MLSLNETWNRIKIFCQGRKPLQQSSSLKYIGSRDAGIPTSCQILWRQWMNIHTKTLLLIVCNLMQYHQEIGKGQKLEDWNRKVKIFQEVVEKKIKYLPHVKNHLSFSKDVFIELGFWYKRYNKDQKIESEKWKHISMTSLTVAKAGVEEIPTCWRDSPWRQQLAEVLNTNQQQTQITTMFPFGLAEFTKTQSNKNSLPKLGVSNFPEALSPPHWSTFSL